jgi:hypothetical protein
VYQDGYKSYSPVGAFEDGYALIPPAPDYRQRVRDEKAQLDDRMKKLGDFFTTAQFARLDSAERDRMARQGLAMDAYSRVLQERIAAFGPI